MEIAVDITPPPPKPRNFDGLMKSYRIINSTRDENEDPYQPTQGIKGRGEINKDISMICTLK